MVLSYSKPTYPQRKQDKTIKLLTQDQAEEQKVMAERDYRFIQCILKWMNIVKTSEFKSLLIQATPDSDWTIININSISITYAINLLVKLLIVPPLVKKSYHR